MVWIKLILFILLFIKTFQAHTYELSKQELEYFKIIDLNNDGFVSVDEINKSTGIIFQLIDINNDNLISLSELEELKEIIKILQ